MRQANNIKEIHTTNASENLFDVEEKINVGLHAGFQDLKRNNKLEIMKAFQEMRFSYRVQLWL